MSLIRVGGQVVKPVDTVVRRFSAAIEGIFRPKQIRRVAEAEADAARIRANADLEIQATRARASRREAEEALRHQQNMETIAGKAAGRLNDDASPETVDEDWLASFFDKARLVSDDQIQDVWARILAGEANNPGSFTKRTLSIVADMGQRDAELFTTLCGFTVELQGLSSILVFDPQAEIYRSRGLNFDTLFDMDAIGLIQFNSIAKFNRQTSSESVYGSYFGTVFSLGFPKQSDTGLSIGTVLVTEIGRQMQAICGAEPVPGFLQYAKEQWAGDGVVLRILNDEDSPPIAGQASDSAPEQPRA